MRSRREKGYWQKRCEAFPVLGVAKARAAVLRGHQHVEHVRLRREGARYVVFYSVANRYLEELKNAGATL